MGRCYVILQFSTPQIRYSVVFLSNFTCRLFIFHNLLVPLCPSFPINEEISGLKCDSELRRCTKEQYKKYLVAAAASCATLRKIVRLSDIVVGGLRFYRHSSSTFYFFRHQPSELAEWNSPKTSHMLGSRPFVVSNALARLCI